MPWQGAAPIKDLALTTALNASSLRRRIPTIHLMLEASMQRLQPLQDKRRSNAAERCHRVSAARVLSGRRPTAQGLRRQEIARHAETQNNTVPLSIFTHGRKHALRSYILSMTVTYSVRAFVRARYGAGRYNNMYMFTRRQEAFYRKRPLSGVVHEPRLRPPAIADQSWNARQNNFASREQSRAAS